MSPTLSLLPAPGAPGYFLPTPLVVPYPGSPGYFLSVSAHLPEIVPSGVDALTANPRRQAFTFERLRRNMTLIAPLNGVTAGKITLAAAADVRGGGNLTVESPDRAIEWAHERIRVSINVEGYGSWGLGVYMPSLPSHQYADEGLTLNIQLMGLETNLQRNVLRDTYVAAAGDNIIDHVRALIVGSGELAGALTDNGAVLATDLTWTRGTSVLAVINALLAAGNYWPLWADGVGQFRAEPAPAPGERPVRWEFTDGPQSIYDPSFTYARDLWAIPNVAMGSARSTGDTEGDVSVVENADPDNPLSTVYRGPVFTSDSIFDVDATDGPTLEAITIRRLAELMAPASNIALNALPVPIEPNDPARFARLPAGIDARFAAQMVEYDTTPTGLMSLQLREEVIL